MSKNRVQSSIGSNYDHAGTITDPPLQKFILNLQRSFFVFDVIPFSAPRMSQSDKWKTNPFHPDPKKRQREVVTKYFAYKNSIKKIAAELKFSLTPTLEIVFLIPMPDSWSEKKKIKLNGTPHQHKPDVDNLLKSFMDSFDVEDSFVFKTNIEKRWAYHGSLIIFK